jgi:hypothetical protein
MRLMRWPPFVPWLGAVRSAGGGYVVASSTARRRLVGPTEQMERHELEVAASLHDEAALAHHVPDVDVAAVVVQFQANSCGKLGSTTQ